MQKRQTPVGRRKKRPAPFGEPFASRGGLPPHPICHVRGRGRLLVCCGPRGLTLRCLHSISVRGLLRVASSRNALHPHPVPPMLRCIHAHRYAPGALGRLPAEAGLLGQSQGQPCMSESSRSHTRFPSPLLTKSKTNLFTVSADFQEEFSITATIAIFSTDIIRSENRFTPDPCDVTAAASRPGERTPCAFQVLLARVPWSTKRNGLPRRRHGGDGSDHVQPMLPAKYPGCGLLDATPDPQRPLLRVPCPPTSSAGGLLTSLFYTSCRGCPARCDLDPGGLFAPEGARENSRGRSAAEPPVSAPGEMEPRQGRGRWRDLVGTPTAPSPLSGL